MNNSLSIIPLLEEITSVFLMTWMDLWEIHHLRVELSLCETLIHQKIVLLVNGSMATLASSLENLESSSQSSRVVSVPGDLRRPVVMTMMHTNGVDLLFITLDTVRGTNIISEQPSLGLLVTREKMVGGNCFNCSSKVALF